MRYSTERFSETVSKFWDLFQAAIMGLVQEREQLQRAWTTQSEIQFAQFQKLTQELRNSVMLELRSARNMSSADLGIRALPSPEPTPATTASVNTAPVIKPIDTWATAPPPTGSTESRGDNLLPQPTANPAFEKLNDWVTANMELIMKRSLNLWRDPEELLSDAPATMQFDVRLLDHDSKLVFFSAEGSSQCLVVALPGGYLAANYSAWFTRSKGNGKVERTVKPAIVEGARNGYQLVTQGVIEQK
jgi:hypothetical protein